jgi:hypothetical protein
MKKLATKDLVVPYLFVSLFIASPAIIKVNLFAVLIVFIFNIKYILYEVIVGVVMQKYKHATKMPWYYLGLTLAALLDMVAVTIALREDAETGFALFALLILTPWYLLGAIMLMVVQVYLKKRSK